MPSWNPDPAARPVRRLGASPTALGVSDGDRKCPDIWLLDNGDIAVVGRDLTEAYTSTTLPQGLGVGAGERLVVIPRATFLSAAKGGLDA